MCVFICFFSSVFVCIFVTVLCMCDLFYHFYFSFIFLTFLLFCYLTALALIRINIYNLCFFLYIKLIFSFFNFNETFPPNFASHTLVVKTFSPVSSCHFSAPPIHNARKMGLPFAFHFDSLLGISHEQTSCRPKVAGRNIPSKSQLSVRRHPHLKDSPHTHTHMFACQLCKLICTSLSRRKISTGQPSPPLLAVIMQIISQKGEKSRISWEFTYFLKINTHPSFGNMFCVAGPNFGIELVSFCREYVDNV